MCGECESMNCFKSKNLICFTVIAVIRPTTSNTFISYPKQCNRILVPESITFISLVDIFFCYCYSRTQAKLTFSHFHSTNSLQPIRNTIDVLTRLTHSFRYCRSIGCCLSCSCCCCSTNSYLLLVSLD